MRKIELPIILGKSNKFRLIKDNGIILTLGDTHLTTRTNYTYEKLIIEDDELSGYRMALCNEKAHIIKSAITQIGIDYDDNVSVYFILISGIGINAFVNVESAEKGNEVLNLLYDWWRA